MNRLMCIAALAVLLPSSAAAQGYDPNLFAGLHWRLIGPFRGGRTVAAVGIPAEPNVFYIGVNNGGVWKTTDYGRVWTPIFDAQSTGSIGAIAVAPSDARTLYVGSGEGLQRPDLSVGDGIYKSTDGGGTWRHLGLRDGQQIPAIIVDPRDPNRVLAAVLGHPYGANEERGVFRSTDGGETWQKVLYRDENTGAMDLAFSPANAQTVFAVLWSARQAPWEAGWVLSKNNGLYKSSDGGTTWRQITAGLPSAEEGLGRIGLATSLSEPGRMYTIVGAGGAGQGKGGLYRSDDGGESWRLVNTDGRLWGRDGDFNEVKVDPKNADVVYVANVVTWKSTDGGKTFTGWRGAPGGDDYHRLWINPDNPQIILNAADQGAVITVNGGETWSSWYNQPTAQMFHITTDSRFPYWIYGGQQESGWAGVPPRGPDGQITFRDWRPVGLEEYGYAAPDPLHPNLVYGGKLTRFDWNTGEVKNVSPVPVRGPGDPIRFVRTAPVIFSPVDPHILYYAGNVLFKTLNGGESWTTISPDLTRAAYDVPASLGAFTSLDAEQGKHRGVIYTIAPSFRRRDLLWIGTDDGLIWVTHTGGRTWRNVTPPAMTPWSKVSIMEASHVDTLAAYAAINRFRLDDVAPHIYRTRDGGKTWTEIVEGIPLNENVNVVREDPVRRGLLFAGTERSVYVSFDDGDHWQSLRQNLPPSSMRDLQVHENDLIVGTHGRSIWILDDLSPLRQMAAASRATAAYLFQPAPAYRARWNLNTDTPLPPDEPAGQNPPDGAVIDFHLATRAGAVAVEIRDARGRLVRRFSSSDTVPVDSGLNIPDYWIRSPQTLSTAGGMHRFVWDLHYPSPPALSHNYPISAIYRDTWREPRGPVALPGRYELRLTVDGRTVTQPLVVRMDPRVRTTPVALAQQFAAATRLAAAMQRDYDALQAVRALRAQIRTLQGGVITGPLADTVSALDRQLAALESGGRGPVQTLTRLSGDLAGLLDLIDGVDAVPTTQAAQAVTRLETKLAELLTRWDAIRRRDVPRVNARLKAAGLAELKV